VSDLHVSAVSRPRSLVPSSNIKHLHWRHLTPSVATIDPGAADQGCGTVVSRPHSPGTPPATVTPGRTQELCHLDLGGSRPQPVPRQGLCQLTGKSRATGWGRWTRVSRGHFPVGMDFAFLGCPDPPVNPGAITHIHLHLAKIAFPGN
jgi:hypothetical protein